MCRVDAVSAAWLCLEQQRQRQQREEQDKEDKKKEDKEQTFAKTLIEAIEEEERRINKAFQEKK